MPPKQDAKETLHAYLSHIAPEMGLAWTVQTEHRFHPTRRWRFDYIFVDEQEEPVKIAVEYDGIMHRTVGHNSLGGILRDSEKINEALRYGWRVFRANAKNVNDGTFFALMQDVLREEAIVTP